MARGQHRANMEDMSTSHVHTSDSPAPVLSSEDRSARIAVTVFPLLILAAFAAAMIAPAFFKPLAPGVNWALGIIMFGMGLSLTVPDFGLIIKRPLPVFVGVAAQYLIMPLVGWALCYVFRLPDAVAVGVILVGCAPGGTASNVISYLAKADVALSVTMTSISTLLAPLMTPLLTAWLVGSRMPVDGAAMTKNILLMVLVPVLGGFVVRLVANGLVERILPVLPWISVLGICYVLLVVVSGSVEKILTSGALIIAVVVCHNLLGYLLGYLAGRVGRGSDKASRTTSIEVGMQNSALAATLAKTHFAATPETALPAAVFSVWHNLSGALLAVLFRRWRNGGRA